MTIERVLSLDLSTKSGWALLLSSPTGISLETYGQITKIEMPHGPYPVCFVDWAYKCFGEVVRLIDDLHPDILVIEETSGGSKSAHSQKILEFIHFLVARLIKDTGIASVYFMTEEWRRETGCKMTKEESKHNKDVKKFKEKSGTKVAYNAEGKRVGKLTRKHINIRRANEVFGEFLPEPLRKRDEDLSDALLLGFSYHIRKMKRLANEQ